MTLWAVVCDAGGAHEAECVYSVWTTREGAEAECLRLRTTGQTGRWGGGCNGGAFSVVEITADAPTKDSAGDDTWIA